MNRIFKYSAPALGLLGLAVGGCQPNIDAPAAAAGTADFTSYVAVGNSLTSGYSDGGLYNEAQATSYPAILAQQFGKTGKGPASFAQPSFAPAQQDGSGHVKLQIVNGALAPVVPSAANGYLGEKLAATGSALASGQPQLAAYTGAQPDNLGVPGISVLSSVSAFTGGLAPYGLLNPFYERLLTAAEKPSKDYVTYIGQKTPTFFTCWMGNNDVLTYASNGGVASAADPFSNLTDTTRFGIGYRAILGTMSKKGTVAGIAANIPNVTGIPYFTTVTVAAVAAAFKAANAASPGVFIQTSSTTTPVRLATSADLLTLTAQAVVATGAGSTPSNPLPNKYVLDADEAAAVVARTIQLNAIIAKTARQNKVALADMNTFFTTVAQQGVAFNAVANSSAFVSGNLFGLDGVHPTPRGYALLANEFIRNINNYYGASIPTVNINEYRGVVFPQ
ncbi:SGNH/GDSL hydrolase family protein [Hymenobacter nivis]|uniref:G-D-S-L family lipolytic protein n=1 Tax=Hymenobacter nivis TaxID=1850093 RepID=A0A2Z3GS32_9BACT|nr:SGNH/GDSL hydrolase family protein [Hymenobacter nivis]AWM33855.1 G-D-S-L family lipolytic protein [Hymenobacter nivis]